MMKNPLKNATLALALTCGVAVGQPAFAGGVPTIDVSSIAQLQQILAEARLQLEQAITQNLKLDEQTMKMLEQIKLMQDQILALKESFDSAKMFLEGDWKKALMPEIPDLRTAFTDALRGQWDSLGTNGSVGGTRVSTIVNDAFSAAGTTTDQMTALANSEDAGTARIGIQANTGAMMNVAAEASSAQSQESLERLTQLTEQIPETQGLKAAIDLNTRMTAELGIQLGHIWQMEAAQTIGLGQAGVMTAATLADEQKFLDLNGGNQ